MWSSYARVPLVGILIIFYCVFSFAPYRADRPILLLRKCVSYYNYIIYYNIIISLIQIISSRISQCNVDVTLCNNIKDVHIRDLFTNNTYLWYNSLSEFNFPIFYYIRTNIFIDYCVWNLIPNTHAQSI